MAEILCEYVWSIIRHGPLPPPLPHAPPPLTTPLSPDTRVPVAQIPCEYELFLVPVTGTRVPVTRFAVTRLNRVFWYPTGLNRVSGHSVTQVPVAEIICEYEVFPYIVALPHHRPPSSPGTRVLLHRNSRTCDCDY